ncbi:hypothetical protein GE09DRAFT_1254283 [Coniochaeta sp. 2T2.1]|nr:hypothetical protein GE09DRAFT_1254283 [Coniochaeta sp. 2T2.1]
METRRLMVLGQSITAQNPHVVHDDWDKENEQPEYMYDFTDDSLFEESERAGVAPEVQGHVAALQQEPVASPALEARRPFPRPGHHQRQNPNYEAYDAERSPAEEIYDEKLAELKEWYQESKDNSFCSQWVDVICGERVFKLEKELVERSPWMTKERKQYNLTKTDCVVVPEFYGPKSAEVFEAVHRYLLSGIVNLYGTTHFLGIHDMQAELLDRIGRMADSLMDWYRPGPGQGFTAAAHFDSPSGLEKVQLTSFVWAVMCVAHFTNSHRALRVAMRKAGEKLAPRLKHIHEFKRWVLRHPQGLVFADAIGEADWAHSLAA